MDHGQSATGPTSAAAPTSRGESPGDARPTVIYIAGSGRCGSTLLERVLGEIPGYVNVGELIQLARQMAPHNDRCGCGQAFTDCPFWTAVGERAFGGWDSQSLESVREMEGRVARQQYLRRAPAVPQAGGPDLAALGTWYERLLRAVAAESGAAYVVDASKEMRQALLFAGAGIDVRVIHLIRDVRGVAFSMSKRHAESPDPVNRTEMTWRTAPALAAALWVGVLSEEKQLSRGGVSVARMRYEDFVRQPHAAIEQALGRLGLSVGPSALTHIGDGRVTLPSSHGLSGNPSRFRQGELALRPDEAWRDQMSRRDRFIVTMIGLRYLRRYYGQRAMPLA
jgi:hypothetical protein